jgi:hypothetical protein
MTAPAPEAAPDAEPEHAAPEHAAPEHAAPEHAVLENAAPDGAEHRHQPGRVGRFDESSRRLSHEELSVARLLVAEGHDVRTVPVASHPTPDLLVCGRGTEIKTLSPGATSDTVRNALCHARRQGTDAIVDARASGLGPVTAELGVAKFAAGADRGLVERVRVLGTGYDRSYRAHDLDRWASQPTPRRELSRELG